MRPVVFLCFGVQVERQSYLMPVNVDSYRAEDVRRAAREHEPSDEARNTERHSPAVYDRGGADRECPFQECATCPEIVVVPEGEYTMGSPEDERDRLLPQHGPDAAGRSCGACACLPMRTASIAP
jgi:hypothetical protein